MQKSRLFAAHTRQTCGIQQYHIRRYTSPSWGCFPGSIALRPRGRQYRTIRLRKASSRRDDSNAHCFGTDPICGDLDHGKSAQGCVIYFAVCGSSFRSLASKGFPSDIRKVCLCVFVYPRALRKLRIYGVIFSKTAPDEQPLTLPHCRWPALIPSRTHTNFLFVWPRLCDDVMFRSLCLCKRTLCATR